MIIMTSNSEFYQFVGDFKITCNTYAKGRKQHYHEIHIFPCGIVVLLY